MITPLPHNKILELNQSSLQAAGLLSWFPIGHYRDGRNLATYKLPRRAAAYVNVGGVVTHGHRRGVQFPGSGTNSHYVFLDGAGLYYGPIRGTNEFSLFMWINAAAIGSVLTAFSQGGGWIQMRAESDGKLGASVDGMSIFESSATLSANTWYHVGFTSVGTAQKLYINGAQDGSASQTPAVGPSTGQINHGRIGAHNSGNYPWNGLLDDLRIHKRTLSDAEVLTVYNETRDGGYGDLAAQPTKRLFHFSGTPNLAPTAVALTNKVDHLAEDADTTSATKIADIVVTDDGEGTNTLSVSGTDAASFEVVGTELRLKAGVTLDYEIKNSYAVTVEVDDTEVGSTPDLTVSHTLKILLVPENRQVDLVEGPSSSFDVVTEIRDERRGGTGRGVSWQPGPAQVVTYGTRSDPSTQAVLDRLDNRFVTSASDRFGKS